MSDQTEQLRQDLAVDNLQRMGNTELLAFLIERLPAIREAITQPVAPSWRSAVQAIIRDVADLPDRTSPDDDPSIMLVSEDELSEILVKHLKPDIDHTAQPVDEQADPHAAAWQWRHDFEATHDHLPSLEDAFKAGAEWAMRRQGTDRAGGR